MLTIRSEQIAALKQAGDERLVERLVVHLRRDHATLTAGLAETELVARVRLGISRARDHELTWESTLAGFVVLMFELGPAFDLHPPIQRILSDPERSGDARMERLRRTLSPAEWAAVPRRRSDADWADAAGNR